MIMIHMCDYTENQFATIISLHIVVAHPYKALYHTILCTDSYLNEVNQFESECQYWRLHVFDSNNINTRNYFRVIQ